MVITLIITIKILLHISSFFGRMPASSTYEVESMFGSSFFDDTLSSKAVFKYAAFATCVTLLLAASFVTSSSLSIALIIPALVLWLVVLAIHDPEEESADSSYRMQ